MSEKAISIFSGFTKKFLSLTIVLTVIAYITQMLLTGWKGFFTSTFDFFFFALIFTLFLRIFRRGSVTFSHQLIRYFLLVGSVTGFLSLLLWSGAFLSNTFPGALSKVILTNGEKTIVYYQMSHIATKKFYDGVHSELLEYAKNGYSLYLEGVLPGSEENQLKLEQALGIKISSGTYESVAEIMGMMAQDETLLSGIDTNALIHADVSVDDIAQHLSTGSLKNEVPIDPFAELDRVTAGSNKQIISYFFRSLMNASIRYSLSSDGMLDMLDAETVEAILDKRNTIVVDTFEKNGTKKAVFLYGALHFDGMFHGLKSRDPRWRIESHTPIYPYVP